MMKPVPEFNDDPYWSPPHPDIILESQSAEVRWDERLIKILVARKFGILLSQTPQIFKRMWNDSLPEDWLANLPVDISLKDDGLRPLTLKLSWSPTLLRKRRRSTRTSALPPPTWIKCWSPALLRRRRRRSTRAWPPLPWSLRSFSHPSWILTGSSCCWTDTRRTQKLFKI